MDSKVGMWKKGEYYMVGLYEEMRENIFPSHFNPIIAEKKGGLFRRWSYSIHFPYKLKLGNPIGEFKNHEELFPVKTLHYVDPIKISSKTQVIGLSKERILISESRSKLVFFIVISMVKPKVDFSYLRRAVRTIKNIIE